MTRTCMKALERNIWRSSLSLQTKIRLYNAYILLIHLYGADTWSMTSTSSGASAISCVFHIQHTSRTTKSDAGLANRQPLFLSRQDGCICSDTLPMLVHLKTIRRLYEQLSVVCLWTGNARLVNQDEPGFERLSSTSSSTILASARRGSVRRNVPSGVNSWRWLCPVKDAPLNDDDEEGNTNLNFNEARDDGVAVAAVPYANHLHFAAGINHASTS